MTLLVLDIRLPEDFQASHSSGLLQGLAGLTAKLVPYVLSFAVLGLCWLSNIHLRSRGEVLSRDYANWWLLYHLLITGVPFMAMVVGRFPDLASAIWLYAGNSAPISAVAYRMPNLTPEIERGDHLRDRQVFLVPRTVSSLIAIGWSFVSPRQAPWVLMAVFAAPGLSWVLARFGGRFYKARR